MPQVDDLIARMLLFRAGVFARRDGHHRGLAARRLLEHAEVLAPVCESIDHLA